MYVPADKRGDAPTSDPSSGKAAINPNIEQALNQARASQLSQGSHMRGPSASGISLTLPTSTRNSNRKSSHLGADLHSIMDDQGMLNPLVSRQLSVLSHYSVRSESGSVMITPEDGGAPFRLLRLIGRGETLSRLAPCAWSRISWAQAGAQQHFSAERGGDLLSAQTYCSNVHAVRMRC